MNLHDALLSSNLRGSGVPHFNLWQMGLPAVTLDGHSVFAQIDVTELHNAMRTNSVWVTLSVNVGEVELPVDVLMNSGYSEAMNVTQSTGIFVHDRPYLFLIFIGDGFLEAKVIPLGTA
jgi:hypothetical protein